jgi:RHH-type rel operon transcriptional repressor/antitoxin RelB
LHYIRICTKKGHKARRREGDKCFFRRFFLSSQIFLAPEAWALQVARGLCEPRCGLAKEAFLRQCNDNRHYTEGYPMASINVRIDDDLKARAYRELEKLGVTPSELMRQALQYVAERGQLPFKPVLMTEDDEALMATVRERLAAPQRVKVSLDDL